ncbi:amidohydrolase family protein [Parvularcula lutaonensis]|uniref:Amidohydrolase family protein n=2 Tax=Parvularcula lutaonensis TaxID=491923 RepID=A0ABV7ME98_9PROT|nr:metal-dependent hydrolase [Parvularcula lutaonensis]
MAKTWLSAALGMLLAACAAVPDAAVPAARYDGPIIDMHLHAFRANGNGPPGQKVCAGLAADARYDPRDPWPRAFVARGFSDFCGGDAIVGAMTDAEVRDSTIEALRRNKAIGVLSGPEALRKEWMAAAPDLFIPGPAFGGSADDPSLQQLRTGFANGDLEVFAEITTQYRGIKADDPVLEPYWQMAAELDVPVGIHIGVGLPGSPHLYPDFVLQSPRSLEPVLKRHPTLRVYAIHAGWPFTDDLLAMLYAFPQLYVDTGVLQIATTRAEYHAFLKRLVDAGFVDRIMYGTDQMNWPGLIDEGINAINDAPFLTYEQKKMILHDNAARFLRMEP